MDHRRKHMPKAYLCFGLLEGIEGPNAPSDQLIFEVARLERAAELAGLHSLLCFGFKEAGQFRLLRPFGDLVLGPQVAGRGNSPRDAGDRAISASIGGKTSMLAVRVSKPSAGPPNTLRISVRSPVSTLRPLQHGDRASRLVLLRDGGTVRYAVHSAAHGPRAPSTSRAHGNGCSASAMSRPCRVQSPLTNPNR